MKNMNLSSSSLSSSLFKSTVSGPDEILFASSSKGNVELVEFAITIGANVNTVRHKYHYDMKGGMTPLMIAAMSGHNDVVQKLLDMDANANIKYYYDASTALMFALRERHIQTAKILIARKDIQVTLTALLYAYYFANEEIIELLSNKCTFANVQNEYLDTLLKFACQKGSIKLVTKLLESSDFNVNIQNQATINTALLYACKNGYEQIVKTLLDHNGVDVNVQNKEKDTPLMIACKNGDEQIVQKLLDRHDVDVNIQNKENDTALMIAYIHGNGQIVQRLLDHGADI